MESLDNSKREVVRGIVDNSLNGEIPQRELAKSVGEMPSEKFVRALDGLVSESVLGKPQYHEELGVTYRFNPKAARDKEYL